MIKNDKNIWLIICFILLIGAGPIFYVFYTSQSSHDSIEIAASRQKFIAKVIQTVENSFPVKDSDYLESNKLTDKGIEFIKNSVHTMFIDEANQQNIAKDSDLPLLEYILAESLIASFYFLQWCPCIVPAQRIELAFQIISDVKKQYSNTLNRLGYVSLGSGDLLQDFIIIAALIKEGYCNLDVNIIDLKYHYVSHVVISGEQKGIMPGKNGTQESKEVTQIVDSFKKEIDNLIENSAKQLRCSVVIEPFTSAYSYIELIKNKLENKAHILVMADPNRLLTLFKVDSLDEANMIEFSDNGLLLIMPEEQLPKVYVPINTSKECYEKDFATIKEIISSTPNNAYRMRLKEEIKKYIENRNMQRQISYYAEPFITFQDLVRYVTFPESLIYGLYEKNGSGSSMVDKINVKKYPAMDVITDHTGKDLTDLRDDQVRYKQVTLD